MAPDKRTFSTGAWVFCVLLVLTISSILLAVAATSFATAMGLDVRIWVSAVPVVLVIASLVAGTLLACGWLFRRQTLGLAFVGSVAAVIICCICLMPPVAFLSLLPEERINPDGTITLVNHFLWGATPYSAEPVGPFFMREIEADSGYTNVTSNYGENVS